MTSQKLSHVLLVEDDIGLGETLCERLVKENYQVAWCKGVKEAEQSFQQKSFDLVILDLGLPDGSGFDLAKHIRKFKSTPIVFMTAMNTAENRLEGYEIGADEFIPKPFHLKEILMRVKHVLENHAEPKKLSGRLRVNQKWIHFSTQSIIHEDDREEQLAKRDFELLKLLIQSAPKILSRDEILNLVWGEDKFPSHRTVDNTIVRLRQALGEGSDEIIRSVRGVGYQWSVNINRSSEE